MNVLFVSAYGPWGRPISFVQSQSESLRKNQLCITDLYFRYTGFAGLFSSYLQLKKFLKGKRYDIIHAHFAYTAFIVLLASPSSKLVVSFMGTDINGIPHRRFKQTTKGRFNQLLSRYVQGRADWIIVKSRHMYEQIANQHRFKTSIVPNGIDFTTFPLLSRQEAREMLLLDQSKKYILFLADTGKAIKNFNLLTQAVRILNKADVVLLTPYPLNGDAVHLYLNACDVLALPSLAEGSPNTIKEALACNCPIVSTPVGDVAERIEKLEGCYLAGFHPADFAAKLAAALQFNARTKGRERIADLSSEKIAAILIRIYTNLVSVNRLTH